MKYRAIGDHIEPFKSLAAGLKPKIRMSSVTTVTNMAAHVARHVSDRGGSDSAPLGSTHHLNSAYRQVPLASGRIAMSIIVVGNGVEDTPSVAVQALPFRTSIGLQPSSASSSSATCARRVGAERGLVPLRVVGSNWC